MLAVRDLTKQFPRNGRPNVLFRDLSFDLPKSGRLALLGRNGQGKSTLIKILGGVIQPNSGSVSWDMSCSWPLGFGGGFQGGMTGLDNIRFIARIYQHPIKGLIDRVDRFAELGDALAMPMRFYSSGMRARLAFGLSLAIEFDCYLIDEIIAVGDAAFTRRCQAELFGQRADRAFVIASHDLNFLRAHCSRAIVIESGRAEVFDDVDRAIEVYTAIWEENQLQEAGTDHALIRPATRPSPDSRTSGGREAAITADEARAGVPSGLWWDRSIFFSNEIEPGGPCPEVDHATGIARNLFFGPFRTLPPGVWRATIFLHLTEDAVDCRLVVEFGSGSELTIANLAFGVGGNSRVELQHEFPDAGVAEIRLWLKTPASHGAIRFIGAVVDCVGDVDAGEHARVQDDDAGS